MILNGHQEGCTPFYPCNACHTVRFLEQNLSDHDFVQFQAKFLKFGFNPEAHEGTCSPISPCNNCKSLSQLQTALGESDAIDKKLFDKFVRIYSNLKFHSVEYQEKLDTRIDSLELSVRTSNGLKEGGVVTVRDLVAKSESELLRFLNFGRKSLGEIKEILASMGLELA
jgi:Bacterial RNA polymerase, alpha chain C terminal domain